MPACQHAADPICSCAGFLLSSSSESLVHGLGGKKEEEEGEGEKMKYKLINQHRERCLAEVGVLPMGSMVWHHPHCAFTTTSRQKMSSLYPFLEDELESLLEIPLLCWGTASSCGHHVDPQEKKPSHCLMALCPVTLGLLPSSACGEGVTHPAGRWTGPSSIGHHQLLTMVYL